MGGDRVQLPAAARRARRGARPRDALGHARARRPARGAGRARPLPRVPARDPARPRTRSTSRRRRRRRRPRSSTPPRPTPGRPTRWRAGDLAARMAAPRDVDLVGHARRAAAPGHGRGRAAPARDGDRRAPRAVGRLGRRLLAPGVRARALAGSAARGGGRAADVRGPHGRRARRPRPAAPAGGPAARPARPARARARVEPRRLPVARRVPGHAPAHGAPPPGLGRRRRRLRPGAGGGAGAGRRRRLRRARAVALDRFCCVAWDTELLGLHWHEGVFFLAAVLEARPRRRGCGSRRSTSSSPRRWRSPRRSTGRPRGARRGRSTRGARRGPAASPGASAARSCARCPAGARARCASCSRSSPPTGRSSSPTAPPGAYPMERAAGHEAALRAALAEPPRCPASSAAWRRSWRSAEPGAKLWIGHGRFGVSAATCRTSRSGEVRMIPRRSATSRVPSATAEGNGGPRRDMTSRGANRRQSAA